MLAQDSHARELNHAEKVIDVVFPARDEAPGVVQPREEPFDLPAPLRAAQRASIPACVGGFRWAAIISMP